MRVGFTHVDLTVAGGERGRGLPQLRHRSRGFAQALFEQLVGRGRVDFDHGVAVERADEAVFVAEAGLIDAVDADRGDEKSARFEIAVERRQQLGPVEGVGWTT